MFRKKFVAVVSAAVMLAATVGIGTATAIAAPESCGPDDTFCYAGYSAQGIKEISDDLELNGKGSLYYNEMETALKNDTEGYFILKSGVDGVTSDAAEADLKIPIRLVGILHDDKAGSKTSKAGLTFMAKKSFPVAFQMNSSNTNTGGWKGSDLRERMNEGDIYSVMPADLKGVVESVLKMTNNIRGGYAGAVATATADRFWLPSMNEISKAYTASTSDTYAYPANYKEEGKEYEFFAQTETSSTDYYVDVLSGAYQTPSGSRPSGASLSYAWLRSPYGYYTYGFRILYSDGGLYSYYGASYSLALLAAFSI